MSKIKSNKRRINRHKDSNTKLKIGIKIDRFKLKQLIIYTVSVSKCTGTWYY